VVDFVDGFDSAVVGVFVLLLRISYRIVLPATLIGEAFDIVLLAWWSTVLSEGFIRTFSYLAGIEPKLLRVYAVYNGPLMMLEWLLEWGSV
jgi:hypothetical protein